MRAFPALLFALCTLAACDNGNIKPTTSYNAPKAPAVRNPTYNPYAAYGEANATWSPPTYNPGRHRGEACRAGLTIRSTRIRVCSLGDRGKRR